MASSGYLSTEEIVALLIDPSKQASSELKYTRLSTDPAQLDGNLAFYHPHKKAFLQAEFTRASSAPRKKIIHCNPLSDEAVLTDEEREVWSIIFGLGYEVLLNPNPRDPKEPIEKCIPVKNVNEFFRSRGEVHPATETVLKKTLKEQKLNPKEYILLDHANWGRLVAAFKANRTSDAIESNEDTLDLSEMKLDMHSCYMIKTSINLERIKKVKMLAPIESEIEFVKKNFPKVDEFIIHGATQEWTKKTLLPI